MSANAVFLMGRLTHAPELKHTPNGTAALTIGIAVNDDYKGRDGEWVKRTHFVNLKLWKDMAERVSQKYAKGTMVYVEGKLESEQWEKDGQKHSRIVVNVRSIDNIERYGTRTGGRPASETNDYTPPQRQQADAPDFSDDDIPF